MSLRARLALLYTAIVGGILLLFGTAVYVTVGVTLTDQVDRNLDFRAKAIIPFIFIGANGQLNVRELPAQDYSAGIFIQIWGKNDQLVIASPNNPDPNHPLDSTGLQATEPDFHDIPVKGTHLRVLSVPLTASNRIVGVLQVATSLSVVETTQMVLLRVLLVGAIISMLIAGLGSWISTQHALSPLEAVTQTALQITRADDLSRRIPYRGPPEDEVGQLINAFNQTLGRLENLFNSQRRFLADVGHELRTPLTVIKGNIDLMRRMKQTDDESMDSIVSEVDRLTRLVGDLLLLAQAESGKLPMANQTVELDTVLLDVMHQMRVLARDRLQLKLGEIDQVLVCGDRDRLKQVLVNLVGNSIKYTPSGGEVIVGLGKAGSRARLTISDNGPGIPAEDIPHIFERFYRGEKSRTRSKDGKGFGLGLSIAYWIVRNHDGTIEVSQRQPHGTTFAVWLPLAQGECKDESST